MEHIVEALVRLFSQTIPAELTVFVLSLMPVIELRGGILAAKLLDLQMLPAFFICLVGTLLPTPFILLFINKIFDWMRNTRFVKLVNRMEEKGRGKFEKINRYKTIGLMIFVAIPLPGTGAWTGSLAAALMNAVRVRPRPSVLSKMTGFISPKRKVGRLRLSILITKMPMLSWHTNSLNSAMSA